MPERLRAAGGDMAKLALRGEARRQARPPRRGPAAADRARRRAGRRQDVPPGGRTGRTSPLARPTATGGGLRGDAVAVVVAKGDILDGQQPAGTIGGDSTSRLIRSAREDKSVKAVVLRVDSPGGSAFASEVIRRECELTRGAGKPVVVSMGSVAASGRLLDLDRLRRDLGAARDDHRLDRHLRRLPHGREAAGQVPRRAHRRRRHHALHGRVAARPRARTRGRRRDPAVRSTTATRSSWPAWPRRGR